MFNYATNCGGYSLSDIAAVSKGNNNSDGMFGDNGWWVILLFLFAFGGWGGNGFGYGRTGGTTTREEIAYGFDMNGLENSVRGVQQGLCDGFYAMNTGMLNGFAGINGAITNASIDNMQNTFGLQNAITTTYTGLTSQLNSVAADNAACCCEIKGAIKDNTTQGVFNTNAIQKQISDCCCDLEKANMQNRYDAQVYNCNTLQAIDKLGDRIIGFLTEDKLATLRDENQALRFAASQAAQNSFITANQEAQTAELIRRLGKDCPIPAYVVPNPNCCYGLTTVNTCSNGCGYNNLFN